MDDLMAGLRELPNLHPIVVNFPIALLPVALGLDLLGIVFRSRDLHVAGRWCLWLGTLAAVIAVVSGERGADDVHAYASDEAEALMMRHMNLQYGTLGAALGLSLWRLVAGEVFPVRGRAVYLMLAAAMVANLVLASDMGGELVFVHGVAVRVDADSLQGSAEKDDRSGHRRPATTIPGAHEAEHHDD